MSLTYTGWRGGPLTELGEVDASARDAVEAVKFASRPAPSLYLADCTEGRRQVSAGPLFQIASSARFNEHRRSPVRGTAGKNSYVGMTSLF
jgi:hypothetical protein